MRKVAGSGLMMPVTGPDRDVPHGDWDNTITAVATPAPIRSWAQPCTRSTWMAEPGHR